MSGQRRLDVTTTVDVRRFVQFNPNPARSKVMPYGIGRRSGEVGEAIGTICFKHDSGYEVVVEFDDGKQESFAPNALRPADLEDAA